MRKLNIIVNSIVPEPIGYDGKTGSVARLVKILKKISNFGDNISILINATEWMAEYFRKNEIRVEYKIIKSKAKFKGYASLFSKTFYLMLKAFFVFGIPKSEAGEKTVVYASSDLFWEVIPAFVYKIKNNEIEWTQIIHHLYPDWRKRSGSKTISFLGYYSQKVSLYLIRKKADKIILMNRLMKGELLKRGFDERKIFVSSNGINYEYFDSLEKADISYDGIFLGRMNASKGIADLIPIWKNVCAKISGAKLAIIGGGEEYVKIKLEREIRETGLEKNIEVLGFLEDEKAFGILKAGKVFIFPSHEEGWGIVIAEALASGMPVVSWDLPVYQEIFENYTTQVEENNINLFAENIAKLLKDEIKRKEIGDKGREFIKKYSWEEVARRELEIIVR